MISTARQSILWDDNDDMERLREGLDNLIRIIGIDWKKRRKASKERKSF